MTGKAMAFWCLETVVGFPIYPRVHAPPSIGVDVFVINTGDMA
jgi:hypothetical protein